MSGLTENLCGKTRPTHFQGVCTVVAKLFNIITPNRAYFGQKDAQQLAAIKRMTLDLNMDIEIVGCPIVRETDGLAMSSRNAYLNPEERKAALILSRALKLGKELMQQGETDVKTIVDAMVNEINSEPLARIDYVEIVDADNLQKIELIGSPQFPSLEGCRRRRQGGSPALAAIAVFIGKTRLIDNFVFDQA